MDKQRTISKELTLSGTGLHTATKVKIIFKPAEADTGIQFVRTDLPGRPHIAATPAFLLSQDRSHRRTSVGREGFEVHTIEHLMAALAGMGIDNLYIEIDNQEVPGFDGSSRSFIDALLKAGIREQDKPRQYYAVKEPIFLEEENASIMAVPSHDFKVSYTLSYDHPLLKIQFKELSLSQEIFRDEIAPARTFCLEEEAQDLQRQGIGCGASYENTLVVGKKGVIKNKLRYEDEFVRHKILDLLGDLYVLGQPLKGHIIALKSGHSLNLRLLKKLDQQKQRYSSAGVGTESHVEVGEQLDVTQIMRVLPHREPFLFVDRIIALEKGKHATGLKNVTINDYFFKGHFPGRPVMPGVLIVEAMAQVGGVMMLSPQENRGKLAYFMAADNIKFRKTVVPGDQLILDVVAGKIKSKTGQVHGRALVEGKVVAEADLMFALVKG
ncbi:MAG: bifunctional UDP-3-O-[3-hydroxymyristoyl] N-acetylglucosamine deacetylase/3-hydroxyacyl-ACP dehydratase [Candidatus Omnitrophota bacterium]|nr:bifunctional UDP-3-O-[3-hydroxymyristoyl] N-acetylglucosamine deacetylase/3-hydroxyacyl-ACP dehydratase [Candidatus Omnitrophota bacterium]